MMNLTFCLESPTISPVLVTSKGKILSAVDSENLKKNSENDANTRRKESVVDSSQLSTDSNLSEIHFIIRISTNCRIQQGELAFCGLTNNATIVLETAKVGQVFSAYSSVSEAINHFN